jgi:hypothetical protein
MEGKKMLYGITVYEEKKSKRKWLYTKEVSAGNANVAFEQAAIRLTPDRIVEIRMIGNLMMPSNYNKLIKKSFISLKEIIKLERPPIRKPARDGV